MPISVINGNSSGKNVLSTSGGNEHLNDTLTILLTGHRQHYRAENNQIFLSSLEVLLKRFLHQSSSASKKSANYGAVEHGVGFTGS